MGIYPAQIHLRKDGLVDQSSSIRIAPLSASSMAITPFSGALSVLERFWDDESSPRASAAERFLLEVAKSMVAVAFASPLVPFVPLIPLISGLASPFVSTGGVGFGLLGMSESSESGESETGLRSRATMALSVSDDVLPIISMWQTGLLCLYLRFLHS